MRREHVGLVALAPRKTERRAEKEKAGARPAFLTE